MSHVDDGELTAYADGAYPADDPVALRIAAHLSTCGNCRTRLEQNHELRDRAAEILAFATPAIVAAPSFETLQAQAATPTLTRRRTFPLAWAASVILAIGLGWFGRGIWQEPRSSGMMVRMDAPAVSTEVKEEAASSAPAADAAPQTAQAQSGGAQERPRDMAANRAQGAASGDVVAAAPTVGSQTVAPPAAPPPSPSPAAVSEFAQRLALTELVVTGVATEYITAAEAERRGVRVPRIPELPITRVGLQGTTTIIEQVLPDETVVTLTVTDSTVAADEAHVLEPVLNSTSKRREAAAPAARAATPQAQTAPNVRVKVGNKSVSVTGDLLPDSLRALGRKIR
jgi:hypothetical protein